MPNKSLLIAIPFAHHLLKLRIIEADKRSGKVVNLKALNNARKELPNAEIAKIFLNDEAYHQMRRSSIDLFYDMVKVRWAFFKKRKIGQETTQLFLLH